ncbi:MAG: excinuclease ABC subunit UvrA [Bacteroidota bacterium]|nr:excinuclease ABC subunit UvrA [Bacteroidota bacterium]
MKKITSNTKENIIITGARLHNLKNLSLEIPKNKITAISGVSGSGKSSLAFNTLFAEGQRRYIESLSSYARQFLGKLKKPDVEKIEGLSPAIAIEQKIMSNNPRSTVGTVSEIYDYMKLLFTRIGKTYSPISRKQVKNHSIDDIYDFIIKQNQEDQILLIAEYQIKEDIEKTFLNLYKQGFSRVLINNKIERINTETSNLIKENHKALQLIIDRISLKEIKNSKKRLIDSIQTAFYEGNGVCILKINNKEHKFSNKFELDGIEFTKPTPHLFSFNNPYGACEKCEGFGSILGIDEKKVITNQNLSIYENVVNCWSGKKLRRWKDKFIEHSQEYNFPIHKPYKELSKEMKDILWNGKEKCKGIFTFFKRLEKKRYKIQNRVLISRYRGKTICNSCEGSRLKRETNYIKINNKNITELVSMDVNSLLDFFKNIKLNKHQKLVSKQLIIEITNRLSYLQKVGLGYLTLDRPSPSLSGGEMQRINLTTSLGSSLVGAMYILDEPSIGLHARDTKLLIEIIKDLRDIGNTVIIVEHDEEIIESADYIIDLGPNAGINGGELVFAGEFKNLSNAKNSLTKKYFLKELEIQIPERKKWTDSIKLFGINQYNLDNIDVEFPLHCFVVITGLSGSGKSTLLKEVLKPAVEDYLKIKSKNQQNFRKLILNTVHLSNVQLIDQNPIGKSSRSNPATYIKLYDDIRNLFSKQKLAINRKYKTGAFSFNVDGGRCEICKGDGETVIEMQFMSDIYLECEDCKGSRFKTEILDVKFGTKNISEILNLSVDQAIVFFNEHSQENIVKKLLALQQVGLGYIRIGQSSNTLSGGEAQRIKLASFLVKGMNSEKTLFIFDEPTIGLHFHDVKKLLQSFNALIQKGHSIICIEHNMDVIKSGDWIIDLGPEGGKNGGRIMFQGTPEELINTKKSITSKFLKKKIPPPIESLNNLAK